MAVLTTPLVREQTCSREYRLYSGAVVLLALTVRATTPGECCVSIASTLCFDYVPPLPEDIAVRLDDRLYDGLYAGLAALEGPLPPERLKVEIAALTASPSLAALLAPDDWSLIGEVGTALESLAAEAITLAVAALLSASTAVRVGALV